MDHTIDDFHGWLCKYVHKMQYHQSQNSLQLSRNPCNPIIYIYLYPTSAIHTCA